MRASAAASGRIVVFAGPSIRPNQRSDAGRFDWRGPAIAGDALGLLAEPPAAMVLIDGLFDERPAIRHKELLELIAAGVRVIGGASMGALRAAELHPFGMIGVGAIFRAYAAARLEGDDEVAVAHGAAEWDYAAFSEPLVNVRATLLSAVRGRAVGADFARRLRRLASRQYYKDRTWAGILAEARAAAEGDLGRQELDRLAAWLEHGRVDLKLADAHLCLDEAMAPRPAVDRPPPPPRTPFTEGLWASVRSVPSTG